ncbi:Poly [ADP-ribose] polymerase [Abortiporus biennis]
MPPRKKAATTDVDGTPVPAAPTRSSTRARAPSAKATATKAPVSKSKTNGKGKGKRTRDEEEDEEAPEVKKSKVADIEEEEEEDEEMDDDEEEPPAQMVTILKRGAAPVDPQSGMVSSHQVYANGEGVWDAMLNQTDVGKNSNKFYVIQLLHPIGNDSSCTLFTRWGRVGENGQQQKKGPFPSSAAVSEFKKQFKAKTATDWENRHGMVAKKGKYTWLERDFEDAKDDDSYDNVASGSGASKKEPEKTPESQLAAEIQALIKLIFSTKLIDAHLSSMNYDARKLPLGKLAKSTILNGFAALKTLSEVIADPNSTAARELGGYRSAVQELTGRYYSIIPHVFGRNRPTVIDDMTILKRELDLVDALGDMEIASKLIQSAILTSSDGKPLNPLDAHFKSLNLTKMEPVSDRKGKEFIALENYVRDTHGSTHGNIKVKVEGAFRVERRDETDAWLKSGYHNLADGERLLLWHGSRTTNFAGILKQGLRIAPPEAPVTGYMFGKGVYFADMMSKSANYCHAYLSDNTGLLLLCEVAAKPFLEQKDANYYADETCKNAKALATKGLGRTQPGAWQDAGEALGHDELKGCHMPKGKGVDVNGQGLCLQYNEYIVYDSSQIRLRYLLMVRMD